MRKITDAPKLLKHEAIALKALATGEATEDQQKKAYYVIIDKICRLNENPFKTTERETNFALGMAHVARAMIAIVTRPTEGEGSNE